MSSLSDQPVLQLASHLTLAVERIEAGDSSGGARAAGFALKIVNELSANLSMVAVPESCESLRALYERVELRLAQAISKRQSAPLREAQRIVASLCEAYQGHS